MFDSISGGRLVHSHESCGNCFYWRQRLACEAEYSCKDMAQCHRHAPVVNKHGITSFPLTMQNDYCGDFVLCSGGDRG